MTVELVETLRTELARRAVRTPEQARQLLRDVLTDALRTDLDRSVRALPHDGRPAVLLVVGVNGTGKTTTTGKLARVLVAGGRHVVLGAADTFRAAAAEQLATWGERAGATVVRGPEGADPASVAFDAVKQGAEEGADAVLLDTAGRLHTKTGLMDELGKVKRVVERQAEVDEVLLVLDATTGQNGLIQARVFGDVVEGHRHRADQAGRHREGRDRLPRAARAGRAGQARRARRGARRPGPVRARGVRRRPAGLSAIRARRDIADCNTAGRSLVHSAETVGDDRPKHADPIVPPDLPLARRPRREGVGVDAFSTGDTAWMLASAALVLLMTPGLAFFYGGMVRSKSVLNMMMMSFSAMGLVGVLWVLYGYSHGLRRRRGRRAARQPVRVLRPERPVRRQLPRRPTTAPDVTFPLVGHDPRAGVRRRSRPCSRSSPSR